MGSLDLFTLGENSYLRYDWMNEEKQTKANVILVNLAGRVFTRIRAYSN